MTDPDDRRRAVDEITRLSQETGGYCPNLITGTEGTQFCRLAEASAEALTGIDPDVLADVAWWRAECDGLRTELDRLRTERDALREAQEWIAADAAAHQRRAGEAIGILRRIFDACELDEDGCTFWMNDTAVCELAEVLRKETD